MCRVVKLARRPYYHWLAEPRDRNEWVEAHRAHAVFDTPRDDPEFGYRFLADKARTANQVMSARTTWRICHTKQWWSVFGKSSQGKRKRPGSPVHDDLVRLRFTADTANHLWLTNIFEHSTGEGKLSLCAIKDMYSGRIAAYSIDSQMKARLTVHALDNAVARRRIEGQTLAGCVLQFSQAAASFDHRNCSTR